jgi:hypothetical protein
MELSLWQCLCLVPLFPLHDDDDVDDDDDADDDDDNDDDNDDDDHDDDDDDDDDDDNDDVADDNDGDVDNQTSTPPMYSPRRYVPWERVVRHQDTCVSGSLPRARGRFSGV